MTLIQNPLIDARLRKFIAAKGGRVVAPMMGAEVHPVVIVDQLHDDASEIPEEPVFERCANVAPAGVGNQPGILLFNPAGSDRIVAAISYSVLLVNGQNFFMGFFDSALMANVDQGWGYNRRGIPIGGGALRGAGVLRWGFNVGAWGASFFHIRQGATGNFENVFRSPIVLEPGNGLLLTNSLDNGSMVGGFVWQESNLRR